MNLPRDGQALQTDLCALIGLFRSRASLEAEILVLRHQLNVLRRKSQKRPTFGGFDRLIFARCSAATVSLRILKVDCIFIEPPRVTIGGDGEEKPIAPNNTPAGRARNRRVEFLNM